LGARKKIFEQKKSTWKPEKNFLSKESRLGGLKKKYYGKKVNLEPPKKYFGPKKSTWKPEKKFLSKKS